MKKSLLLLIVILPLFLLWGLVLAITASAQVCQDHNVYGWAWSENIGWISFNCEDTMALGEGVDYGVDIDPDTAEFSGYAWSENIGWISFEEDHVNRSNCPDWPASCVAEFDFNTGEVSGWAKPLFTRRYEYFSYSGAIADGTLNPSGLRGQTFTIGTVAKNEGFAPTSARLRLKKASGGCSGDALFFIKQWSDAAGAPTGSVLCSGITACDVFPDDSEDLEWIEISLQGSNCFLSPNQKYVLYVEFPSANVNNALKWSFNPSDDLYGGGNYVISDDGGASWYIFYPDGDHAFEIWGIPGNNNNWIRLNGALNTVAIDGSVSPAEFTGYGWGGGNVPGDSVIGWVSFNSKNSGAATPYAVRTTWVPPNIPPTSTNLNVVENTGCSSNSPVIFLNWTFNDPNGDSQTAYQLQVDNSGPGFPSPEIDTGQVSSSSNSYSPSGLSFGTQYWWRLKVYDGADWSINWADGGSFTTDERWPAPDFTWGPTSPSVGEIISFTNNTSYCSPCSYEWDFGDGSPLDYSQDPTYAYSVAGTYTVQLTSTIGAYSCSISQSLIGAIPLPAWHEIPPF